MSGAEAITVIQLIDACIGITKTIIDIGRAVCDAQGLPPKLKVLFEQLPAIEDLLESAHENQEKGRVTKRVSKNVQPILKQCEQALGELRDIFRKACTNDEDDRSKRIWKGGKDSQLQKLLGIIQDNLRLLEQKEIYTIGDKLDELHQVTEALAQDDSSKYTHTGTGNIVANEGGSPTNYVQGGKDNRQIYNPAVYNEAPTNTYNTYVVPERPETPPDPSSNAPFQRDPDFVDRSTLTKRIDGYAVHTRKKSQLAIEYLFRTRDKSPKVWTLWIHASNATRFEQSVRDIAGLVKIYGRKDPKADIFTLFRDWLRDARKGRWVVILDNADDASFLLGKNSAIGRRMLDCLPVCDHGWILITTRSEETGSKLVERSDTIAVDPMNEEDAVTLLEKKLGSKADKMEVKELASALECMPLAITQAAAYINHTRGRCSVRQYLDKLRKSDRSKKSILDDDAGDLRRDRNAQNSIILTWQISFEHIHHISGGATGQGDRDAEEGARRGAS